MYKAVKHTKVSDEIVNQIKRLISDGKLKPGDRLPPERELIKQLGVSRPSLREALNALAAMGFLDVKQAKRTFVKSMTSERMNDPLSLLLKSDVQKIFNLIEVRKAIETWGAFHAAQRATEEDIEQLEAIIEQMKGAFEKGRSLEKLDADFHLAIAQATHNTVQIHIMSTIYDYLRESVAKIFTDPKKVEKLYQQHYQIFSAVKNHSPDKAKERTFEHLNYVESEVKAIMGQKEPL
ncbi:MAG: FadR/GntR family transcriptional regulator [Thermodesulfobacteriota bacterium]|nr:FadR/GntR family transcriptional regulator [Thermodesulfobacteriota bacterium]